MRRTAILARFHLRPLVPPPVAVPRLPRPLPGAPASLLPWGSWIGF
jgi:hypothetical protein